MNEAVHSHSRSVPATERTVLQFRDRQGERFVDLVSRVGVSRIREALADRIEQDIALLDLLDGDPDLEPSLGSPVIHELISQARWAGGETDDREDDSADTAERPGAMMMLGQAEPPVRHLRRACR